MKMRILPAAAAATLILTSLVAGPAAAAAPGNDSYGGRVEVVEPLPVTFTVDTSEATTDADDSAINNDCGAPATDASVWYEYTPTSDGEYFVDVAQSTYTAGVLVASGTPGSWVLESCGPEGVVWPGAAGVTYTILAFDDQSDGGGNGGTLQMAVGFPPPPPTIDLTVDPVGTFNSRTGEATISGVVTCDPGDNSYTYAELDVEATQQVGRFLVRGGSYEVIACDGQTRPWSVTVMGETGLFKGGKAMTVAVGYGCGYDDCSINFVESVVMLRGGKR